MPRGVANGRLTLTDGPALPAAVGTAVTVQQVAVTDPDTGGPFLGIDGTRDGTGTTGTATFSLWRSDDLRAPPRTRRRHRGRHGDASRDDPAGDAPVAQVTLSTPVTATGVSVETFAHTSTTTGTTVTRDTAFFDAVTRDGGLLLAEVPAGTTPLTTAANQSVVVVALEPVGDARPATLGPGTLLVPDEETTEIDRGQSLANHELTHTVQYAPVGTAVVLRVPDDRARAARHPVERHRAAGVLGVPRRHGRDRDRRRVVGHDPAARRASRSLRAPRCRSCRAPGSSRRR